MPSQQSVLSLQDIITSYHLFCLFILYFLNEGQVEEIILEARLVSKDAPFYKKSDTHINGLSSFEVDMRQHIQIFSSKMVELHNMDDKAGDLVQELDFVSFPPGSVIAFK